MSLGHTVPGQTVDVFKADIDMSVASQWQFSAVGIGPASSGGGLSDGDAALMSVAKNAPYLGVLQNNPQKGAAGVVMINGFSKILLADAVVVGDALVFNSNGAFIKASPTQVPIAIASEAGAAGNLATGYIVSSALSINANIGSGNAPFKILTGPNDPDENTGGDPGDLYINTTTGALFGPATLAQNSSTTFSNN